MFFLGLFFCPQVMVVKYTSLNGMLKEVEEGMSHSNSRNRLPLPIPPYYKLRPIGLKHIMKILLSLGVVAIIGVVAFTQLSNKTTVVNKEAQVIEKEVKVDALDSAIKQAQEASSTAIRAKAQEAYDEAYRLEMDKVELEVVKSFNSKLNVRQTELEKQTKQY